ncbi:MAG: hypothetical protein HY862_12870 [Chloroflexi bacterium]|nr:hypothetical protein [Chloroflexota bacterium]
MNKKRAALIGGLLVIAMLISACGVFEPDPTLTPIFVTATPNFIIVTNTYTPAPTSVLAPTLAQDSVAEVFTPGPPTLTPTRQITMTPTFTPTPTDTPVTPGAVGFVPVGAVPGGAAAITCPTQPMGGFQNIYASNPSLSAQLACPIGPSVAVQTAFQSFERGTMIWVSSVGATNQSGIYVLYANNTYQRFADTWLDGVDPSSTGLVVPSPNLQEPIRGFGKVWRESGGVKDGLGWANNLEAGGSGFIQTFERGEMLYLTQTGQSYILVTGAPGVWSAVAVPY